MNCKDRLADSKNVTVHKPQLLCKIDAQNVTINMAVFVPDEDGIIGVCEDRSIRVWLKRDNGIYWPSVCQFLSSAATALDYHAPSRKISAGSDNGTIHEYAVSEDFNSVQHIRDYLAHSGRITGVIYASSKDWIISCARDNFLTWHCSSSGLRCGGYKVTSWCTSLQFDSASQFAFLGEQSGVINILKLQANSLEFINTLKGHQAGVHQLVWDADHSLLASASSDHSVIVWDIGSGKGTAYELQAHHGRVLALALAPDARQLISAGDDQLLVFWRMGVPRQETPTWAEGDACFYCELPFFWNVRKMWQTGKVGVRQHHCRKCGHVVCEKCSDFKTTFPAMGFEYPVRVCRNCHESLKEAPLTPLAYSTEARHSVRYLAFDQHHQQLLSVGKDCIIKIWDVSSVLQQ